MANFFVGQRVRVVHATQSRNQGREDVIARMFPNFVLPAGGIVNCKLKNSQRFEFTHTDQLEPILPEGSAPSEFTFQQLMDSLQEATA